MRRYIIASHHKLAYGLKDTVDFLTNGIKKIYDVNAYVEDGEKPIEEVVSELFASFDENDEVLVFADMMGGSVYQKFYPYMSDKVHVVCGINLPLTLALVLESEDTPLTQELVHQYVEDSKNQIVYVNEVNFAVDEDDEQIRVRTASYLFYQKRGNDMKISTIIENMKKYHKGYGIPE